jgi:cytochrome c-type biogenesis protein CcmE
MPSQYIAATATSGGGAARVGNRRRWFAVAALGVAAAALLAITAGGIGQNLVYYWGPTELRAAGDKAIGATIEFDVIDRPGGSVRVMTHSVPPQMFREGIGVVVEGTMTPAGHFESRRLMVSHSNEYRAPDDPSRADTTELMRTTEGLKDGEAKQ